MNVALPTEGPNAGQIDITYMARLGEATDVVIDVVGYTNADTITLIAERLDFMQRIDPRERTIFASGGGTPIENGDGLEEIVQYIDELPVGQKPTGVNPWTIRIEGGEYVVDTLELPGNIRLQGDGVNQTVISSLRSVVRIDEAPVTIADLTMTGNGTQPTVDIDDEATRLERVNITSTNSGVSSALSIMGADVIVVDSTVTATGNATGLLAEDSTVTVDGSTIQADFAVAMRFDTSRTVSIIDSVVAADLGGVAIAGGRLEVRRSQLSGNNGIQIGGLPAGGSIDVLVAHSEVSRIFFNGGTPSIGARSVEANYSSLGGGIVVPNDAATRADLRHATLDAGGVLEMAAGTCTATAVGNTFAQTGCP